MCPLRKCGTGPLLSITLCNVLCGIFISRLGSLRHHICIRLLNTSTTTSGPGWSNVSIDDLKLVILGFLIYWVLATPLNNADVPLQMPPDKGIAGHFGQPSAPAGSHPEDGQALIAHLALPPAMMAAGWPLPRAPAPSASIPQPVQGTPAGNKLVLASPEEGALSSMQRLLGSAFQQAATAAPVDRLHGNRYQVASAAGGGNVALPGHAKQEAGLGGAQPLYTRGDTLSLMTYHNNWDVVPLKRLQGNLFFLWACSDVDHLRKGLIDPLWCRPGVAPHVQPQQRQQSPARSPRQDSRLSWAGLCAAMNVISPEELTLGALIGEGGFGKASAQSKNMITGPVVIVTQGISLRLIHDQSCANCTFACAPLPGK